MALFRVLGCAINQGRFAASTTDMSGKHVLVTGPSIGGIGFETALGLAGFGAKVYLAARNVGKGEAAAAEIRKIHEHAKVEVLECDTSDLESVRKVAAYLTSRFKPRMDVIVANAGCQLNEHTTNAQGVEMTFATCTLGHHLLMRLVKPVRFVSVTGDIYCMARGPADPFFKFKKGHGMEAYHRACLGRLLLANEIRRRIKAEGMPEVVSVHPGVIATNILGAGAAIKGVMSTMLPSPRAGAQSSIFAASCPSSELPPDTVYFHNKRGWVRLPEDDLASNAADARALFEQCDSICGL